MVVLAEKLHSSEVALLSERHVVMLVWTIYTLLWNVSTITIRRTLWVCTNCSNRQTRQPTCELDATLRSLEKFKQT